MSPSFKHPRSWFSKDVGVATAEGEVNMAATSPFASLIRYRFQWSDQTFFIFVRSPSPAPRTTGTLLFQEHVQRCPPHSWARNGNDPWFATQVCCWMLPSIDYRQPRWWHELSSASVAISSGRQISGASLLSIKFWTRFSRSLTWGRNSLFSRWDWCQGTVTSS